jgi:hypothetical protein
VKCERIYGDAYVPKKKEKEMSEQNTAIAKKKESMEAKLITLCY